MILCRSGELIQVLVNLINNAADAVVHQKNAWVCIDATFSGNSVCKIRVTDSGEGIPDGLRSKVLLPYFTTKSKGKGTGLGLSISKTIVEAHSGRLYVAEGTENTQFVVELPLDPQVQKKTILLVDDEEDILMALTEFFRGEDCLVFAARNAQEAIDILVRKPIDTIVTDINMPGVSGLALAEEVYEMSKSWVTKPKVIFMTGEMSLSIPTKIKKELGSNVFYKPFDFKELRLLALDKSSPENVVNSKVTVAL